MKRDLNIMSFGDHLEELRRRMVFALLGPIPIFIVCLIYGGPLLAFIIHPLETQLAASHQPVRLLATSPVEPFGAYLKVALSASVLISAPWILYQLWLFIAPGLYHSERRFAYFLIPASAVLTTTAMVFLYTLMLPVMLRFFIVFGSLIIHPNVNVAPPPPGVVFPSVPTLAADPPAPSPGDAWINSALRELRIAIDSKQGKVAVLSVPLASEGTISQRYRIGEYVNLVFGLALVFAVAFQLPIAMLLLSWTGLLEASDVTPYRKHVLFVCAIAGAIFTPADPGSMILLMTPLYMLFELGLLLMRFVPASRVAGEGESMDDSDAVE